MPGGALLLNVTSAVDCSAGCVLVASGGQWALQPAPSGGLDVAWTLLSTYLVILMQLGFAMLEIGSCRETHRGSLLTKNILDASISSLVFLLYCWWASPDIVQGADGHRRSHLAVFQWAFSATCVTICSGSMAERTNLTAYLAFVIVMAGLVYPQTAESAWGSSGLLHGAFHGWPQEGYKYHDFAGSGVVHLTGGAASFVGITLVGRRIMRPRPPPPDVSSAGGPRLVKAYMGVQPTEPEPDADLCELRAEQEALAWESEQEEAFLGNVFMRRFESEVRDQEEFAQTPYLQVMGMFTLWVGWYGFNSGSTQAMDGRGGVAAGVVAWNTTVSAAAAAFGAFAFSYCCHGTINIGFVANGLLCGLVAITGGCDVATEPVAVLIGLLAGLVVYPLSSMAMRCCHLDDPVDAVAVHAAGGLFGILAVAACRPDCEHLAALGGGLEEQARFCLPGHSVWHQAEAQAWGGLVQLGWSLSACGLVFGAFALAESISALQAGHVLSALLLLEDAQVGQQASNFDAQLKQAMRWSPVVRGALLRSGLAPGAELDDGARAAAIPGACSELRLWHSASVETALELRGPWRCIGALASLLSRLRPVRELARCRLRIAPVTELERLSAFDVHGQVLVALRKAVLKLDNRQRSTDRQSGTALEGRLNRLSAEVRRQGSLLRSLGGAKGPRRRPAPATLDAVAEEPSGLGQSSGPSSMAAGSEDLIFCDA